MKNLLQQLYKFGIVGVIATLIDWGIFYLLYNLPLHLNPMGLLYGLMPSAESYSYLIAKIISFSISTCINYSLSMKYVFQSRFSQKDRLKEFIIFVVLSLLGMGLTLFFMWLSVDKLMISPNIANILVAGLVMVINFILRKIFIEGHRS